MTTRTPFLHRVISLPVRMGAVRRGRWPSDRDRGDVPGWVLITIMTAGLVIAIWALAGEQLEAVFRESISRILDAGP